MYIVLEIQVNNGTVSSIVDSFSDRNQAESKYHQILTSASVSDVDKHSAVLIADNGVCIKHESYFHFEPETESE